eukprot:15468305-Alexandrium_andersonii.AAC.1
MPRFGISRLALSIPVLRRFGVLASCVSVLWHVDAPPSALRRLGVCASKAFRRSDRVPHFSIVRFGMIACRLGAGQCSCFRHIVRVARSCVLMRVAVVFRYTVHQYSV